MPEEMIAKVLAAVTAVVAVVCGEHLAYGVVTGAGRSVGAVALGRLAVLAPQPPGPLPGGVIPVPAIV
jgi:hypothetical protein